MGLPTQTQKDELTTILDKLHTAGINAVLFSVRPECDAYYQSSIEPWSHWLSGIQGSAPVPFYDPLEFAVSEAHKRGMEMHAWLNPYRAVWAGESYPKAASHVTRAHPDWLITIGAASILDPGKAVVRNYTLSVIADIVRRYDVDGIIMDDYFYLEGTTTEDAATFSTENRGFTDLGDWRRDNVNILIRSIRDTVNAIKPWLKFGMSPAGIWKNGVPPGVSGWDPYSAIYCDAVAWLQGGYIDYISPQLYRGFGGSRDYALLEPWWGTQLNGRIYCPSLPGYQIGQPDFGGTTEIARMIRFNRATTNTQGSVLFTANNIADNLGGLADSLRNDLNRWPALVPRIPWKDSIAPQSPRNVRFGQLAGTQMYAIQWDLPQVAPDGDSASWYAVYRLDHRPTRAELDDSRNMVAVEGHRYTFATGASTSGGPAYIAVTALDRNHNESDTSHVLVLTINKPAPPLLAHPANGARSIPESLTVRWHAVPSAMLYHLQIAADPFFASLPLVNDSTIADTVKLIRNPVGTTTYYWRVRAGNVAGFGDFSGPFSFTTGMPTPPVLLWPPRFISGVPIKLTLLWRPSEGATTYRLQIGLNASFTMMERDTSNLPDTTATVSGLSRNTIYQWRVRGENQMGSGLWSTVSEFLTSSTGMEEREESMPTCYELGQNYPNPFNPSTTIRYGLPNRSQVTLTIFSTIGQQVALLQNGEQEAGYHEVRFDGKNLSSGVYFYRIQAGEFVATKRLLLLH
jgi:uncharacterized lipoprotein YddW (UPF0748 family)